MSDAPSNPAFKTRRLVIRLGLCLFLIALGAFSLLIGKGHTIVLDDMRPKDGGPPAVRIASVIVDGQPAVDSTAGARDLVKVRGQRHRLTVNWMDGSPAFKTTFTVSLSQEWLLLSLPKLKAGMTPYLEPFFPFEQTPPEEKAAAPTSPAAPAPTAGDGSGTKQ